MMFKVLTYLLNWKLITPKNNALYDLILFMNKKYSLEIPKS